jgi:hypothetical protein
MPHDRLQERLDELDLACQALERESEDLRRAIASVSEMRRAGLRASEIVEHGPGTGARRRVREASLRLTRALHAYRTELVRSMVDEEDRTIAEVARVTRNARQVISRLYHEASPR